MSYKIGIFNIFAVTDNTSNAHKKLIRDSDMKIEKVNGLCKESLTTTSTIFEKCSQVLGDSSSEQKIKLTNLFKELESKQIDVIAQIQEEIQGLVRFTKQQKATTESMCKAVVESLQEKSKNLQVHTTKLTERISEIKQISDTSIQHLTQMHVEIEKERAASAEECTIMEEIIEKLNTLKEKSYRNRKTRADAINTLTVKLEDNTQSTVERLQQSTIFAQAYCEESCNDNKATQEEFEKQTIEALKCSEQQTNAHSMLKEQLRNMQQDGCARIVEFTTTAATHLECTQKTLEGYADEMKRARLESELKIDEATDDVKTSLTEDSQRLKQHVAVSNGLTYSLQQNIQNYANTYKNQVGTCVNDVDKFKQSELKTYAPTGKRNVKFEIGKLNLHRKK